MNSLFLLNYQLIVTKNNSLNNSSRSFELNFDFKYRNRFKLLISILEIEFLRFSNQINTNYQNSNRVLDLNSIIRLDTISLNLSQFYFLCKTIL
jgi:hypothetical protein